MDANDNADVISRLHRALFDSDDLEAVIDAFFAPTFVSHNTPPELPAGIAGVKAFFAMFRDGLSDIEVTIDQLVSQNDAVAVATTTRGSHTGSLFGVPPTGRRVSVTGIDVVRLESGKIIEHRGLTDTVGLLRQLTA
jgi:predicted ester cyclase